MGRADAGRRALALTVWMALIAMAAGREGAMAFTSFQVLTYNPTSYGTPYGTPSPPASGSSPFVPAAPAPSSSSPATPSYSPPYSPTTPSSPSPTAYSPPAPPGSSPGSYSPPYSPTPSSPSPDYTPGPPYSPTPSGSSPLAPSSPPYSPAPSGSSPGTPYDTPYGSPAPSGSSPSAPTSPDAPLVPSVPAPATPSYAPPSTNPSNCPPLIPQVPSGPADPYPPYTPDPSVPTNPAPAASGTCTFWSGNTQLFPNFLTILTSILDIFGGSSGSIFGSQMTLYQGLTNSRPDAFGSLLRQGSAAVLNSYTNRNYPYTPYQVKSAFRGALVSQQAAAVQAVNFENANRGFVKRQ